MGSAEDGPCSPPRMTMSLLPCTGLHVFPTFVAYELTVLMVLTLSVVIMKVLILLCGKISVMLVVCDPESAKRITATYPEPLPSPSSLWTG